MSSDGMRLSVSGFWDGLCGDSGSRVFKESSEPAGVGCIIEVSIDRRARIFLRTQDLA